ncbi:MAG: hypothetical protein FWD12_03825 [Alphaproteobacteria bacterium]|nr:hypothetical protein [Alphaproteobacteria bacterium]
MILFAVRRLLQAIPILLGVSLVGFALVQIVPGNPIDRLRPHAVIAEMKPPFGAAQPLPAQSILWLTHAVRGDFGLSLFNASPVWPQLAAPVLALIGLQFGSLDARARPVPGQAGRFGHA